MRTVLACLILALSLPTLATAQLPAANGRLIEVRVVDADSGDPLPVHSHRGLWYVAGATGQPYVVELRNRSRERLLAVVAIDGINVVTGQTADPAQSGYVLEPGQRASIRGWRKSLRDSAEFYFTALPDSYAARTDRPFDVGVIGVAVFRQAQRRLPVPPSPPTPPIASAPESYSKGAPATGSADARESADGAKALGAVPQELGTGHGQRRFDPVRETRFERASIRPSEVLAIYYDERQRLVARGVIPRRDPRPIAGRPNPFPNGGFAPDPWR